MLLKTQRKSQILYFFVAVLLVSVPSSNGFEYYSKKPDFMKSCQIYKPGFTKCSTELTQAVISRVLKGDMPELSKKLGPLDPMKIESVTFKPDNNQAITFTAKLDELVVSGLSDLIIKESRVSKKDFSWLTTVFVPKVHLKGKYDMNGKILLLPISGKGGFFIDLENVNILMHTITHLYEKGGLTFYNVTGVQVEMNMTGSHTKFENLFNGQNKEIEESTNQFFNENWRELFEALRPLVLEVVDRILLRILKASFHAIPATFMIEDIPNPAEFYKKNKSN